MRLFQYWDAPEPPAEVAEWTQGFRRSNPELDYRLYDRDAAARFIAEHVGDREARAFDAIAVPSMQSDYFRYCAVWALGGVYVDADLQSREPLAGLLDQAPKSLCLVWDGHMVASLLMCRAPRDAFLRACLDLSTDNVEDRWGCNAYMGAGPGVMNVVRVHVAPKWMRKVEFGFDNVLGREWGFPELLERARDRIAVTAELRQSLKDYTLRHMLETEPWLGTVQPAYKKGPTHWLGWKGSIYRA